MMTPFDSNNWYWSVNNDLTQVYSSASGTYVPVTDATYTAWEEAGNVPSVVSANGMLQWRIDYLEQSVTFRMRDEAATGSTNVFKAGTTYAGQTALQAMTTIRTQIDALRSQLT